MYRKTLFRAVVTATTVLALAGCGGDDDTKSDDSSSSSQSPAAAVEVTEESAAAAYHEFVEDFIGEVEASVEASLETGASEGDFDDMGAYLDANFPQTQAWFDADSFASETHLQATLRYLVGVTSLAVAFDEETTAEDLIAEMSIDPSDIVLDGDTATIAFDDSEPFILNATDDGWLIDGSIYDDEWFAEQGTTAEEALNS